MLYRRDSRIRQLELDLAAAPKSERVERWADWRGGVAWGNWRGGVGHEKILYIFRLEVELKSFRDQLSSAPKQ